MRRCDLGSPEAIGMAYASSLRMKADALRTPMMLTMEARVVVADALEALADIAETHPQCFLCVRRR